MLDEWIGTVIGDMHRWRISIGDLAAHMSLTREYVSMVLNGHRSPEGAEEKFKSALAELIAQKEAPNG